MRPPAAGLPTLLVLTAGVGLSQAPAHYIAIDLPNEVRSESVFIRYMLAGEEIGGWVQPRPNVSAYVISTARGDSSVAGIKAVLYAPGCAIQTLDIPLSDSNNPRFAFLCRPLGGVGIALAGSHNPNASPGMKSNCKPDILPGWAQPFLGLGDILVSIPVGDVAYLSADDHFCFNGPRPFARSISQRAGPPWRNPDLGQKIRPAGTMLLSCFPQDR